MGRLIYCGLCLLACMVIQVGCSQQQVTEKDLIAALDSLEQKYEWLEYQTSLKTWEWLSTGQSDSLQYYRELTTALVNDQNLFNLMQNGGHLLSEELDRRRRDILYGCFLFGRVEADPEISLLRDSLSEIDINFRPEFEGERRSASDLYSIFRYDPNRRRRESAYLASCAIGSEISDGVERLFRLRNQKARKLGYNSFLALAFSQFGLNLDEYHRLLTHLDSLTEKLYLDILDRMRVKLNVDEIEYWDLNYAYADINVTVDSYFPADSQLGYIRRSLKAIDFNLDKMPIYFDLAYREGKSQFTYSFPVKPPHDIRILGNQADGMYSTMVLLHEIGHAVHYASITQDRDLFARNLDGSWAEAMARIFASFLEEEKWLATYPKMPPRLIMSYLTSLKEQNIVFLRRILLLLDFEYEAFVNPNRDLNKLYWDMFVKYMKLPRHDDVKPWAGRTHYISLPAYMQNYLYADLIAAQTFNTFREDYGDPVDNPQLSAFLVQNYFRFGARYPWQDLLTRGTDENLNPKYYIESLGL